MENGIFFVRIFVYGGRTYDYEAPFDESQMELIVLGDSGTSNGGNIAYELQDGNNKYLDIWLKIIKPVSANYPYMIIHYKASLT